MHLGLFREYLDHEFSTLKETLPFEYDLERIIDDFILINIFIGNDFLPHLPGLHITEGALNRLFEIYKRILPQAGASSPLPSSLPRPPPSASPYAASRLASPAPH